MASRTREARVIASTKCPMCGSPPGQKCREGVLPHDYRRGTEDLRKFVQRVHSQRRAAWVANKTTSTE